MLRFIEVVMRDCAIRFKLINVCLFLNILLLFSCETKKIEIIPDYNKNPVILIHGLGLDSTSWSDLKRFLIKSGYPPAYIKAVDLKPNDGANISAAENQIAPAVEALIQSLNELKIPESKKIAKVDIVSHSMGALSSRWYTAKMRPERVRIWISLAGANHGSDVACKLNSPGASDSCPAFAKHAKDSLIQVELNGGLGNPNIDETPFGIGLDKDQVKRIPPQQDKKILYFTMRIEPDKWIKPESSAEIDGASGVDIKIPKSVSAVETSNGNFLLEKCDDHDGITKCKDSMELVLYLLNHILK
jgi:hypothetical protein